MRITGGTLRNRTLYVPKGQDIRPASDKVRQAVFNMLAGYDSPSGAHVLDGFCGSGAYGLEALSRGATSAFFIDLNTIVCKKNIKALGQDKVSHVLQKDMRKPGRRPQTFIPVTLAFLDAPYRRDLIDPALQALRTGGWCADDCLYVLETEKEASPALEGLSLIKEKIYGDTKIILAR